MKPKKDMLTAAAAGRMKGCTTQTILNAFRRGEFDASFVKDPCGRKYLQVARSTMEKWTPNPVGRRAQKKIERAS